MLVTKRIMQISNIYERNSNRILQKYDLTLAQMKVLQIINHRQAKNLSMVRQYELEQELLLSNPAVTRLLDRLEEKEFIKRCPDPKDRRAKIIQALPKAEDLKSMVVKDYTILSEQMVAGFNPEEIEQLEKMLDRLLNNIYPPK